MRVVIKYIAPPLDEDQSFLFLGLIENALRLLGSAVTVHFGSQVTSLDSTWRRHGQIIILSNINKSLGMYCSIAVAAGAVFFRETSP